MMKRIAFRALIVGAIAFGATAAYAAAQPSPNKQTPKAWNWSPGKDGTRVERGNRVNNPDGSWREQVREGNCTVTKEKSAAGEYKETRQCAPH